MRYLAILTLAALLTGCATTATTTTADEKPPVTVNNPFKSVASVNSAGTTWFIKTPPRLEFTGVTATGREIIDWAQQHGLFFEFVLPDATYAQLDHVSALRSILWLKRFNNDTGATYTANLFDCEDFASGVQHYGARFGNKRTEHGAGVFVIYARMTEPFAGVRDGYHALNVAWTDQGVFVFEPQGVDLVAQDLLSWPNVDGISRAFGD